MAHGIMEHDNMMYNKRETPWHGIGTPVDGLATATEAISKANLDWKVDLHPLKVMPTVANNFEQEFESHRAVVRTDVNEILGVVGSRYEPLQNEDAFGFFDPLVERNEAIYETAGSIYNGKRIWLLAKLPDTFSVGKSEDVIEKYVLLTNSHDGSKPVVVKITPVRVVCNNTLSFALKKGSGSDEVSIRHTTNIHANLTEAHRVLEITDNTYSVLNEAYDAMYQKQLKEDDIFEYVKSVLGHKHTDNEELSTRTINTMESIERLLNEGAGHELFRGNEGNVWQVYNSITEYVDHEKSYRKNTDTMDAKIYGSGAQVKQRAFKEALSLVS